MGGLPIGSLRMVLLSFKRRGTSKSRPSVLGPSAPSSPAPQVNICSDLPRISTHGISSTQTASADPDPDPETPSTSSIQVTTPVTTIIIPVSGASPEPGPQNLTPASTKKSLWEQAIERLCPDDQSAFDFSNPDILSTLSEVTKAVEVKRGECVSKQWKLEKKDGKVVFLRDYVEGLLCHLNKYAVLGDTVVKYTTNSGVGFAWTGFRFLLMIATNDIETMANIFTALDHITQTLSRCAIYESLHINSFGQLESVKALVAALPDLYASILAYLCSSKRYFSRNTTIRILDGGLSPYIATFQPLMDKINSQETRVERDARVAAEEFQHAAALKAERQNSDQQQELLCALEKFQSPVSQIKLEVIEINEQIQAGFKIQAKSTQTLRDELKELKEDKERKRRCEILRWLSQITFENHHAFVCQNRLGGTGEWLLKKSDFIKWKNSLVSSVLWLHGIAGAGKTKLASLVIDTFQNQNQGKVALAYFYCNYKENKRRDPEHILRTIVKQLSTIQPRLPLPKPLTELYEEREDSGFKSGCLRLDESMDLIVKLTESFEQTVIVIDALDECEKGTRVNLFGVLQYILKKSKSRVKIFVTSRDDDDIILHLADLPNIYIRSSDNSIDINSFIKTEIERCISEKKILRGSVSPMLKERLISTLINGAHGMFLWAHLQIISICKEKTVPAIEDALKRLPADLTETFSEILSRIRSQSPGSLALAEKALMFIMCAQRPLHLDELKEALRIEPNAMRQDPAGGDGDGLTEETILDVCQNLVVIDDSETNHVFRFAHLSVQDFLVGRLDPSLGHTRFAEVCLTFLCWPISADVNGDPYRLKEIENHALSSYSTANWAAHVRLSNAPTTTTPVSLEEKFLSSSLAYSVWWDMISAASKSSELGKCRDDVALHKQILDSRERILGGEHPDALITVMNMASCFSRLGRYEEAMGAFKQVLTVREKVLGKEHPDTLVAAHEMANSLNSLERHEEAAEAFKQVLTAREKVLGEEDPSTLTTAHWMARSLGSLGRHEEAVEAFKQVLTLREKVLGKEHRSTLATAHWMARSLNSLRRHEEAAEAFKQALAVEERVLWKEHPSTLAATHEIANSLDSPVRHEEAAEAFKQTLAVEERVLGKEHPKTLSTVHWMANSLGNLGKHKEAAEKFEQALAVSKKVLGEEHPGTLAAAHGMARSLGDLGRHEEAAEVFMKVLIVKKKVLGEEHPGTLAAAHGMARSLDSLGRHEDAAGVFKQVLIVKERILGKEPPDALKTAHEVAYSLASLGRYEEATEAFKKVLAVKAKILGEEHPCTLRTAYEVACSLSSIWRHEEAAEKLKQVLAARERVLGKEHPDTLITARKLAYCLQTKPSQSGDNTPATV